MHYKIVRIIISKDFLRTIIQRHDENKKAKLNLLNVLYLVKKAWHNVSKEIIKNCWKHVMNNITENETPFIECPFNEEILELNSTRKINNDYNDILAIEENCHMGEIGCEEILIAEKENIRLNDNDNSENFSEMVIEKIGYKELKIYRVILNLSDHFWSNVLYLVKLRNSTVSCLKIFASIKNDVIISMIISILFKLQKI